MKLSIEPKQFKVIYQDEGCGCLVNVIKHTYSINGPYRKKICIYNDTHHGPLLPDFLHKRYYRKIYTL